MHGEDAADAGTDTSSAPTCCAPKAAPARAPLRALGPPLTSGALLAGSMLVEALAGGAIGRPLAEMLAALAIAVGGATFVPGALRRLLRRRLGVDTLMTLAALGAIALGKLVEAATLAFLFALAERLEGLAVRRSRANLRALLELVPPRARVRRAGRELELPAERVAVGDTLILRPGERAAADGVVRSGHSALDLSLITGEALPVACGPGDRVVAGALNSQGLLQIEVTRAGSDHTVARLVRLVERETARRGRVERLAERVARPLVPAVLVLAAATALIGAVTTGDVGRWLERALVVLVAAAPCAFAIAVPVGAVAAVGAAARRGVVIKGGAALERLAAIRVVALDKTGTLTENRPRLVAYALAADVCPSHVLAIARALAAASTHPLARALARDLAPGSEALARALRFGSAAASVDARGALVEALTEVRELPGSGVEGRLEGEQVRLGRISGTVRDGQLARAIEWAGKHGASVVALERGGQPAAIFAIADAVRADAAPAVAELARLGVATCLLTGDSDAAARAIAEVAGIREVHASLLPEQKLAHIAALRRQHGPVAMVGDGINDTPALAGADVGVAVGALGSDAALAAADVAFLADDLGRLPELLAHARRARRIMLQGLVAASAIVIVLAPLAAVGVIGLAAAVTAHELAAVLVVVNGLRAARWPRSREPRRSGLGRQPLAHFRSRPRAWGPDRPVG